MRKFKHKQTGFIATETTSEKNYKVTEPKNFTIPKWIVENSSEWEEVKEKDYVILTSSYTIDYSTQIGYDKILSVKRLSDGTIFTFGDKVHIPKCSHKIFTITKFYEDSRGIHLLAGDGHVSINKIEHYKPKSGYNELFLHMSSQHRLILCDSEMQDIARLCKDLKY